MNLRKQMLVILLLFTIIGTVGMWIFTNNALKTGFEEIEVSILEGTVLWGVDDIYDFALILDSSVTPIAAWDDMYEYADSPNPEFVENTFSDYVFQRNEFNLVVIYSNEGELIYGKYYDYQTKTAHSVPQLFTEDTTYDILSSYNEENPSIIGLLIDGDQPIIIASRPILDTSETMPSRGTLVIGLNFSEDEETLVQDLTGLPIEYYTLDSPGIPDSIKSTISLESPFTYQIEQDEIRGYYLVEDLFGEPGLVVTVLQFREVYQASQEVRREFLAVILGIGFLLGSVAIVYADKTILQSVLRLTDEISKITEVDDLSARVHESVGDDEITQLTKMINNMLERLQESRDIEKQQQEEMDKLREESTKEIFETAKKISYLVHNELERPLRSMKQVAYSLREENIIDLAEMLESGIKYNEATLLELSNLTNLGEPKRTVSDLNEVVDAAIANIDPKVGVTIEADTGEEFLAINIDALKITRAIENVIRNSVESIENRGEVHVVVTNDEEKATVTVSDNGSGMTSEELDKIFEPFYTTKPNAMGLGLPYARQVIEAHNGTITISSKVGVGTTVTLEIPLRQASD